MTSRTTIQEPQTHRRRNAIIACVIGMIAIGSTIPSAAEPFTRDSSWLVFANLLSGLVPTLAWLVGLILVLKNRVELGVQIGLIASLISIPVTSYWMEGVGIANAIAIGVGATIVAGVCLRPSLARLYIGAGIGAALASLLIDALAPRPRLIPEQGAFFIYAVVLLAIAALVMFLFLQFPRYSLRTKLIIVFVGLALLSTLAITLVATDAIRKSLSAQAARDLRTRAQAAALSIGLTMDRNVDRLTTMSLDKRVQNDVSIISDSYPAEVADRAQLITNNTARWASADPQDTVIRNALNGELANSLSQFGNVFLGNKELLITDNLGSVIAARDWQPTYNFGQSEWWQIAYNSGRGSVYIGQPEFDPMINEYGVRIAVPIFSEGRTRVVGVVHSVYTLSALQRALLLNSFGDSGKIDLLFPLGQILTSEGSFRALQPAEFQEIKMGIDVPMATLNYRGTPLLSSQGIVGVSDEQPEPYLRSSAWRTIATLQADEALGAVDAATQAALLAGLATIGVAILLALLLAQFLTRPIRNLTTVAEQVQAGDLSARAMVESSDEIGLLAQGFNNMTARLQDTLSGLERRVTERTQELSSANLALQSNAAYLSALSDTSTGLFERLDLNQVLQAIVERAGALIGTQDGFVFFSEPGENEIEMRVGSGLYDDLIGTRAQSGVGVAGTVWQTGMPMVIEDYQKWEGRLPGSRRDALHAIAAVPLTRGASATQETENVAQETVGVIGLAFTDSARKFGKNEVEILQRFAQLASIALDNAQLYATSENRVQELAALNTISQMVLQPGSYQDTIVGVGEEVRRIFDADFGYYALLNADRTMIEFPYAVDEGKQIQLPAIPTGEGITWQVISTGEPLLMVHADDADYDRVGALDSGDGATPHSLLAVPIRAGENVIGVLSVQRVAQDRSFTNDDRDLLTTIAASIGVSLENARLADATQRQLAELSALYRIGTTLSTTEQLETRLRTVGLDLTRIFSVSSVYISLYDATSNMIETPFYMEDGIQDTIPPRQHARGFVSHVIDTRHPLLINHNLVEKFEELGGIWIGTEEAQTQSYLGMPLIAGDQVLGVVALNDKPEGRFTQSDLRLLETIASAIASAIQNARLFEQTQRALAETERLALLERESSEQVQALNRRLTREGWRDYLDQLNSRHVVESVGGNGAAGSGASHTDTNGGGTNGGNGNGHTHTRVPIHLRGELIGEIELESDDGQLPMSEDEMGLVTHVAENIGLALDNARLFTETQRRVTELDALNQISQAVTTELALEPLLDLIGEQVRSIFQVDNVYIALYDRLSGRIDLPYFINDGERAHVEAIEYGEGITSHIIRTRAPLAINRDTDAVMAQLGAKTVGNSAQSYLGVPIIVGEDVIGVISIQNSRQQGMFDDANVRLMETIAATVGAAIQNAQLYGAMQQEVVTRQRAEEEIKLSLREKEVLLKEIHHRVKNNLQIITSLLNLQSAQFKDPEASAMFRESQSRVRSMALIHEKLYQSKDLARVDFDAYVRDLMVYLFRSYASNPDQIRTTIEMRGMFLAIDTAIPCGLIISELVTNTLKYAFPDGKRGELYLGLGPIESGDLRLQVRDNGVGFKEDFDWRESDSLGLQLVSTLTSQLHGTIEVNGQGGTSFVITFQDES